MINMYGIDQYPKVSVIIPIYNCADNIEVILNSIKQQEYQGIIEIIAVDNNSTDKSLQILSNFPNVTITQQNLIQNAAATRNKGIEIATGEIIAFIDGDCVAEKDWLSQGLRAMQENNSDRIGGKIGVKPIFPHSSLYSLIDALFCFDQKSAIENVQACMTGNLFIKRSVFDQIGMFNQDFVEMEDMEFGMRATRLGITLAYADKAIVWHPPRQTFKEMWHKSKRNGKGTFILCQNNPKWVGKFGWKHPLRCIKILVSLRKSNWKLLPFPAQQIPLLTKIKIYLISWIVINIGESCGYLRSWIKFGFKKSF